MAKLLAANVPPQQGSVSVTFSAGESDLLIEALANIDPDSIPLAQTQNVLGWITSIASYDSTESGTKSHPLDHLINFLRERELR